MGSEHSAPSTMSSVVPSAVPMTSMTDDRPVKLLNCRMRHRNLQYVDGITYDSIPFDPSGSCGPGGVYWTRLKHIRNFLDFGTIVADVKPLGRIYTDPAGQKWKSEGVELTNFRHICTLSIWTDEERSRLAKCEPLILVPGFVQTKKSCLETVTKSGMMLQFVRKEFRTPAVCMAAVQENGFALKYVPNRTHSLCFSAVHNEGFAILFVPVHMRVKNICDRAIYRNPTAKCIIDTKRVSIDETQTAVSNP